jgi:outer membrane lipoprotein carrier protein
MRRIGKPFYLLWLAILLLPVGSGANEALSSTEARKVVADYIETVGSFRASFWQILREEAGEVIEEESGEFWLQRPGKFRWHYVDPSVRQIVASSNEVWMYDADLDQVTVRPLTGELEETPAALLVGELSALDNYLISGQRLSAAHTRISMQPLSGQGDFETVTLDFTNQVLSGLELRDRFGQRTEIVFTGIKVNPALDAELFRFVIPEGADLLDQRPAE